MSAEPAPRRGCGEGDCGACTVVIGELAGDDVRYKSVNACIQFLATLDGKQLLTVEDISAAGETLHPAQEALAVKNGTQCGFCTPGFVMSLFALKNNLETPDRAQIDDALAGNLCRCTGYGTIVDAARSQHEFAGSMPVEERQSEIAAGLRDINDGVPLTLEAGGQLFHAPTDSDQLAEILLRHPDAILLAGGTDIGLWVTKLHRRLETLVYLGNVAELTSVRVHRDRIDVGAGVTLEELRALVAPHYPDFGEVLRRFGSLQIRNLATLGGNVANGSPIGDSSPLLIALGARLTLRRSGRRRPLPLEEFFIDYGVQNREPGEFIEMISIPIGDSVGLFRAYKLSKRFDQDISTLCGAFNLTLEKGLVKAVRIAFGGMAAVPKRAHAVESALLGRPWNADSVRAGMAAMTEDYAPIDDMRGSALYRSKAAGNLLLKFYNETNGGKYPTRLVGNGGLARVI